MVTCHLIVGLDERDSYRQAISRLYLELWDSVRSELLCLNQEKSSETCLGRPLITPGNSARPLFSPRPCQRGGEGGLISEKVGQHRLPGGVIIKPGKVLAENLRPSNTWASIQGKWAASLILRPTNAEKLKYSWVRTGGQVVEAMLLFRLIAHCEDGSYVAEEGV
jgi:hypothetical protein